MRLLRYLSVVLLVQGFAGLLPSAAPAQQSQVTLQLFYDELSPYGTWTTHPAYGYVWLPMDDPDSFFPYGTGGHWVLTEYGWTWVSTYKWGWAPFHYGRWDYDPAYGWFWIPDVVWGPAWVIWRHAPGYYGWAPMRPGISITIVIGGKYLPPVPWWIFCEHRHFGRKHLHNYYTPRKHYGRILGESRVIEDTYEDKRRASIYIAGPSRDDIRKETGRDVDIVTISDRAQPGEELTNGRVSIYRPVIQPAPVADPKPAPKRIEDIKTHRTIAKEPVAPSVQEEPPVIAVPDRPRTTPAKPQVEAAPKTTKPERVTPPTPDVKRTPNAPAATPTVKSPQTRKTPSDTRVKQPSPTVAQPRTGTTTAPSGQGTTATPVPKKDDTDDKEEVKRKR